MKYKKHDPIIHTPTTQALKGGFENKYRELILDKAEFKQRIGWEDLLHQKPHEIDESLRKIYRD